MVSIFNKIVGSVTLLKIDSNVDFFLWVFQNFENSNDRERTEAVAPVTVKILTRGSFYYVLTCSVNKKISVQQDANKKEFYCCLG